MYRKLFLLISLVLLASLVLTSVASADLVAWYKFDEGSGSTANDSSGNGNTGTLQGSPSWVTGRVDGALDFDGDGSGDYVSIANESNFDITDVITITAWIKTSDSSGWEWQSIVTKGSYLRLAEGGYPKFVCNGTSGPWSLSGSTYVKDGEWHHIAGVYDGSKRYLYVDGIVDASMNSTGSIQTSDYNVNIARNAYESGLEFEGIIDDPRIYHSALSQADIVNLYAAANGGNLVLDSSFELNDGSWTFSGSDTRISSDHCDGSWCAKSVTNLGSNIKQENIPVSEETDTISMYLKSNTPGDNGLPLPAT